MRETPHRPATHRRRRGQATVEFALVAPLFVACTLTLVAVAVACVRIVGMHDLARRAARAASVADDPCLAATRAVPDGTRLRCTLDDELGTVTIGVSSRIAVPFLGGTLSRVLPWADATMIREPPLTLG